jgi:hypothetical protein
MYDEIDFPPYGIEKLVDEILSEEIEAIPGALEIGKTKTDPITLSVVLARAEGIMSEMTETILAAARNPILYGAKDFTCTWLNARAKVLFMFDCLPAHAGTLSTALRWVIRSFEGDISEGDVFVNNAPYSGNAHAGDWTMFAPVFHEGKFVVWGVSKCDLIDIGCPRPTSGDVYAKEVYQEGIHFPGVRVCRNHEMIPDIIRFLGYSIRYFKQWYGDFLSQLGSLWVAENRIKELCDRFDYETVKRCFEETLKYGDRKMKEEISTFPAVTVEEEMTSEKMEGFCPDGVRLNVKLSIDPDEGLITFDYRDMPDQLQCSLNLTYAASRCSALQGTLPILDPSIPLNDGALDRIQVLVREGAVAGIPRWPAGTMLATTAFADTVSNLVSKTWARVLPDRAMAGMAESSVPTGEVMTKPVFMLFSGPSMGSVSGLYYAEQNQEENSIVIDMGGTSFDVSTVIKKRITTTREGRINNYPTGVAANEILTLGAGGGSIAWVDPAGILNVGPRSSGAIPGPACYLRGGVEPTVTDSCVTLGCIVPDFFLGGQMEISPEQAQIAIKERIADPLNLSVEEAALGICQVTTEKMVGGILNMTVRRGIDPREFVLVLGGGATGLFAAGLAEEIDVKRVIIPKETAELCVFGALNADISMSTVASKYADSNDFNYEEINQVLWELEMKGEAFFDRLETSSEKCEFESYTSARYPMQVTELRFPSVIES